MNSVLCNVPIVPYCCYSFKCTRQMACNARKSSAKRLLHLLNAILTILVNFPCAIKEIKTVR